MMLQPNSVDREITRLTSQRDAWRAVAMGLLDLIRDGQKSHQNEVGVNRFGCRVDAAKLNHLWAEIEGLKR